MSANTSVAVIGQGFVGGSLTTVLSERGIKVHVFDKAGIVATGGIGGLALYKSVPTLVKLLEGDTHQHNFSGIYFVCVPTPMFLDTGECDTSIVESVLNELAYATEYPTPRIAVVKSTVPPGSVEKWNKKFEARGLRVIFNPEFLTEANALDDMRNQDRIILGGPRPYINNVKQLFQQAFPNVLIVKTSSTTAEMVKYFINIHLASRVVLSCEFYDLCNRLDSNGLNIDYDKVVEYAKLDKRLGGSHMNVPGPDGKLGARGHCVIEGSIVSTKLGDIPIENVSVNSSLSSFDHNCNVPEFKTVKSLSKRRYEGEVITFSVGGNSVTVTPEHLIPVERNGAIIILEAQHVLLTDLLFVTN